MPRSPKNLTPEMLAAVEHWRWVEDQLDPIPEVTAPKYSAAWMEQPRRRKAGQSLRDIAEDTGLGVRTVRTITNPTAARGRATQARMQRIAPDRLEQADYVSRRKQRKALPRRIKSARETSDDLRKRAKGIG